MDTNDFITILSQSAPPRRPPPFAVALLVLCLATGFVTVGALGFRPDIHDSLTSPGLFLKTLLLVAAVILSGWAVQRGATPLPSMSRIKGLAWGFGLFLAVCVIVEWVTIPASRIFDQFLTGNFISCLISVSLYGLLGTVGLIRLMRSYAPADSRTAATLAGLAAATAGALGYSLHCPFDSPTFIAVAYGLPVLAITIAARHFATRFVRW